MNSFVAAREATAKRELRWHDYVTINFYWIGINIGSGILTPLLLPYLVALYMPDELKNTSFGTLRVVTLAVAMLVQPLAGMLSDRSTLRWGRRRPFIVAGALGNVIFLGVIGASQLFVGSDLTDPLWSALRITAPYAVLLLGTVLWQISTNVAHGAMQGVIPDLVPEGQRGRASGVKAALELLPIVGALFVGPIIEGGHIWTTLGIIAAGFVLTMVVTVVAAREEPPQRRPMLKMREPVLRLVALTAIFVITTRVAVWLVNRTSTTLAAREANLGLQVGLMGLTGFVAMAGSVLLGVYLGAVVGIGAEARSQRSFIWWVINRLLFLAAITSVQGFAQYYLADYLNIANAVSMTTVLMGVVGLFLVISALGGGYLADRFGRKPLVILAGITAGVGTFMLLSAREIPIAALQGVPMVMIGGCVIGLGTGTFMATHWALGTDLVPPEDAGRYLGISNLAGAGAGIVGAGIGGPMADYFNSLQTGLGYLVIFAIYAVLFLLSSLVLTRVKAR